MIHLLIDRSFCFFCSIALRQDQHQVIATDQERPQRWCAESQRGEFNAHAHAHTHTHEHAHAHALTHSHTHIHNRRRIYSNTSIHTRTRLNLYTLALCNSLIHLYPCKDTASIRCLLATFTQCLIVVDVMLVMFVDDADDSVLLMVSGAYNCLQAR